MSPDALDDRVTSIMQRACARLGTRATLNAVADLLVDFAVMRLSEAEAVALVEQLTVRMRQRMTQDA